MSDISRTAKSMEYAFDGIADKFRMPRNRNDAELLNTARAFAIEAVPYEADFIAYGLDTKFVQDLTVAADAFEATFGPTSATTAEHIAAAAEIAECIRRAMVVRRILDGIVKNVYANSVGKLAACTSKKRRRKRSRQRRESI